MTKKELKEIIKSDQKYYMSRSLEQRIRYVLTNDHIFLIKRYMYFLRLEEYYYSHKGFFCKIKEYYYARKKNNIGNRLGFFIRPNSLGKGATIFHHGTIIIHGKARLGENCKLHGDNCIGNDGINSGVPIIGNNVDIGFGAKIIGSVFIADNVRIGAGAVVVNSCMIPGTTLVGVPAHAIFPEDKKNKQ